MSLFPPLTTWGLNPMTQEPEPELKLGPELELAQGQLAPLLAKLPQESGPAAHLVLHLAAYPACPRKP